MEQIPITDVISLISGRSGGRFPWSHSFLIQGDFTVLIDTGAGLETLREIKNRFSVDFLINSHCHPDHSAGNWIFENVPLHVPQQSFETHGRLEPLSQRLAEPGALAEIWIRFVTEEMGYQEKIPTHSFRDEDIFDFGACSLQALHTPGHTADHFCFFEPEEKILFSFDLDMTPFGPYYGHRESDIKVLRSSLQKIRGLKPRMIVSSHRDPIREDIESRIDRFESVIDQREEKILSMIQTGVVFEDILRQKPIYQHYPYQPELLQYWEGNMIRKHLDALIEKEAVVKNGDVFSPL